MIIPYKFYLTVFSLLHHRLVIPTAIVSPENSSKMITDAL
jgi:hypothetical protein